jgi:hypothetical protein
MEIFYVRESGWQEPFSASFSTLKMEAICSSETSVDTERTTWRYIPEDGTLHNHRCENLKYFYVHVGAGMKSSKSS